MKLYGKSEGVYEENRKLKVNGKSIWERDTSRFAFFNGKGWTITEYKWRGEVVGGHKDNWISYEDSLTNWSPYKDDFAKSKWTNYPGGYRIDAKTIDGYC